MGHLHTPMKKVAASDAWDFLVIIDTDSEFSKNKIYGCVRHGTLPNSAIF
jgi:hypothetical protein